MEILYPYLAVLIVSVISLVGILSFLIKKKNLDRFLVHFVSFAAGALLAAAFFDLIPQSIKHWGAKSVSYVFLGIILFFIMERFLFFYHCHRKKCPYHTFTYVNLIGDGIHNFTDGMIIAASFLVNVQLGIMTTIAIIFHEIPQEFGDFSILIYGGIEKKKALLYNFAVSLTAFIGVTLVYFSKDIITNVNSILVPLGAGGFIYLATTDLLPIVHKIEKPTESLISLGFVLLGAAVILLINFFIRF